MANCPQRFELARALTHDEIARADRANAAGLTVLRHLAFERDPYVWVDPWTGQP